MSTYSIKDLEHLSGIKAHTLRIWEQRYNFLNPKRTDTNIRYYDDKDLKLILNVSLLKDYGFKISKIAKMDEEQMLVEVIKITEKNLKYPDQIHALTLSMIDLDEDRFEKIMSTNILHLGFESTMINIIYPFLSKIGVLWQTGAINPAQEHFISNLVRHKIIVAIDGQFVSSSKETSKYLFFLPEGELHELSLLFCYYLVKSRGYKGIYLGQTLPFEDLVSVYDIHKPEYIVSIFTSSPRQDEVQNYINKLSDSFSESQIILSGYQVAAGPVNLPDNCQSFSRIEEFISYISEIEQVLESDNERA
ncbi:MerR family transcriptional regulator [Roseivirga sp. BDSF3-8]|uniref:MerR family transcriptional regulator n=1 Tax=Roseivirga sp. BDSF3-8 TaxID=3241598 RepID=UPI0035321FA6